MPPAATAKIDGSDVVHAASLVTFMAAPLLIVAIAVNCAVSPMTMRLLPAPMILRAVAVPADGEVTEDVGDDEDPQAAARIASNTAALVWRDLMRSAVAGPVPRDEDGTAETAEIAEKRVLCLLGDLRSSFRYVDP